MGTRVKKEMKDPIPHNYNVKFQLLSTYLDVKTQNKEIDRVHKRALRILLDDCTSSFDELLQKIGDTWVHVKSLRNLMIEIYKCLSRENPYA